MFAILTSVQFDSSAQVHNTFQSVNNMGTTPGFCDNCGSILPLYKGIGSDIVCYNCEKKFDIEVFGKMVTEYTIQFNRYEPAQKKEERVVEAEGPVVERRCVKCGNNQFSYATLQLRSVDEGQTVFYTCTKCK